MVNENSCFQPWTFEKYTIKRKAHRSMFWERIEFHGRCYMNKTSFFRLGEHALRRHKAYAHRGWNLTFAVQKDHAYYHAQWMVIELLGRTIPSKTSQILPHPHASQNHRQNTQDLNGANTGNEQKRRTHWIAFSTRCHGQQIWCSLFWRAWVSETSNSWELSAKSCRPREIYGNLFDLHRK